MLRHIFFVYLLLTCWAFDFLITPLLLIRILIAMESFMLISVSPGDLFATVSTPAPIFETWFWGSVATFTALARVVMRVRRFASHLY